MSKPRFKKPRVKLDRASYHNLRRQTLRRDGWRCQVCGSMKRLELKPSAQPICEQKLYSVVRVPHTVILNTVPWWPFKPPVPVVP